MVTDGSSAFASASAASGGGSGSGGGVKVEGVSDKAMRILLAHGRFVEACQVTM